MIGRRGVPVVVTGLIAGGLLAAPFGLSAFAVSVLSLGLCYGLFAYGLDLAWGRAGLLSVGHAAFFGLGAYASALSENHDTSFPVLMVVALLASVLISLLIVRIGLAAGRPEAPLILLTIGVSLLLQHTATTLTPVTSGSNGLSVSGADVVGIYYRTVLVTGIVVALCSWLLVSSRFGARLIAASRNPERAAHTGIDHVRVRATAFVASAAVSTVAGALYAPAAGLVSPQVFGLGLSTSVLVWLAVGGRGSTLGPFLGAIAVTAGQQTLGDAWQGWYVLGLAAVFILVIQFAPGGLVAILRGPGPDLRLPRIAHKPKRHARVHPVSGMALSLRDVRKSFGPVRVLDGVDLDVPQGRTVCLIGPNGAGKSTLLSIIAGQLVADGGTVRLFGTDVTDRPVHERIRMGVGRMFQIPSVLTALSPADNVRLAAMDTGGLDVPEGHRDLTAEDSMASGVLSLADRRRLELAMVLAGSPRLVILDEPAAGLGPDDTRRLTRELAAVVRRTGCAMLVVEHDMDIVRELADDVVVLHEGRTIAHGPMDEVSAHPAVRAAYLGVS
ncbi:branched-chain amino acid transport system permease protein [Kibdelosporangium banguiense]|uniref:Branched-chain amino acid transport system permease protein n=1 Tax=Kibdelosporangium banguiense TaxID=1365924 RepID=A0ABS4TWM5_9PSEU|nr:ATP-binding cassette domain-containing protein [Kibdelosporangium banguiense]MBP2328370.1 branched-chain amino acid transport system permease protein [Kibdelosporangium banguiense]